MARKREGKRVDPELQLDRRLATYPQEMWEILDAAKRGAGYSKMFNTHHEATAFSARFYRFRMDALQKGIKGALNLRDLMRSGRDAKGELFTTNAQGEPPYLLTWTNVGVQIDKALDLESEQQPLPQEQLGQEPQKIDASEEFYAKFAGLKQKEKAAECEHEWDIMEIMCLKCGVPKPEVAK